MEKKILCICFFIFIILIVVVVLGSKRNKVILESESITKVKNNNMISPTDSF